MRLITMILMILPLAVMSAADAPQVEIPSNIERLFDKATSDNQGAVSEVVAVINDRNQELKAEIDKKLSRHKGMTAYQAAIGLGLSNADIVHKSNDKDAKEIASIYLRLEEMSTKTVADYIPESADTAGAVHEAQTHPVVGRWNFTSSNGWIEFKEDGTFQDSWGASGALEVNGKVVKWVAGRFSHEVTVDGNSFAGKRSDNKDLVAVKAP